MLEEVVNALQELLANANREGIIIEFETRDGDYFEVGTAECYGTDNIILRS